MMGSSPSRPWTRNVGLPAHARTVLLVILGFVETCMVLYVLASGDADVTLIAAMHVLQSFTKQTMLVASASLPNVFGEDRLLFALALLMMSSWTLFALYTFAMLTVEAPLWSAAHTQISILAAYTFCSSIFMSVIVARKARRIPKPPRTLKDITCQSGILQDVEKGMACEMCCVCLSDMVPGDMITELSCGHVYHTKCVEGWATHQLEAGKGSVCCPLRCAARPAKAVERKNFKAQSLAPAAAPSVIQV
eukprot:TRINITY_DN28024_c0_g2_i4.p1 TRINITY_DN28024_c0_g2~~TRINITY_DN28024_c0_g2_i4.p1  ORF type:complete len:249 (-),score=25.21 TRINITY_DN28024_c0_g2_i4:433-1179(-)